MKLNDEIHINCSREQVFAALNNTDILKKSIPGCEKIERISETKLKATVVAKIGPIKAKFNGQVTISDLHPPQSYTISGEGSGGAAGFAKGRAKVILEETGLATILRYEVQADVGGKIAQLGGRLIDGTAKKLASEFFNNFQAAVSPQDLANQVPANTDNTIKRTNSGGFYALILASFVILSLVVLYFFYG
jgi:carbon monoxide dehydrogenase subunit G